jgi:hypothetical protein
MTFKQIGIVRACSNENYNAGEYFHEWNLCMKAEQMLVALKAALPHVIDPDAELLVEGAIKAADPFMTTKQGDCPQPVPYSAVQHGKTCEEIILIRLHNIAWVDICHLRVACMNNAVDYSVEQFNAVLNDLVAAGKVKQDGIKYSIS